MSKYIAFLRAVNLGKKNKISKEEQIKLFEKNGAEYVKAYLGTGNIVFSYSEDVVLLQQQIEEFLQMKFETEMPVIVRKFNTIEQLVAGLPFGNKDPISNQVYYVTLSRAEQVNLEIPSYYSISSGDYEFISNDKGIICSVLIRKKPGTSPNAYLERITGTWCTSRNWNTLKKIVTQFNH